MALTVKEFLATLSAQQYSELLLNIVPKRRFNINRTRVLKSLRLGTWRKRIDVLESEIIAFRAYACHGGHYETALSLLEESETKRIRRFSHTVDDVTRYVVPIFCIQFRAQRDGTAYKTVYMTAFSPPAVPAELREAVYSSEVQIRALTEKLNKAQSAHFVLDELVAPQFQSNPVWNDPNIAEKM